ncbi:RecQ family ATP-dependent DNA helicase [Rhodothermus marinus]|uniref:RecQ family ATP-dependent DNA helicase n=1 Tax=Rhodothermus marinus TaxID=29549 RepID=UPI0012BA397D|nr:RecQ family ATP-dependent DNA helicase [Rhodothermus marinus]BBM69253.1 ATP-dependent DNA helicase RecQ [Rhodothermus marinus]BBM72245.1 ATP-dependent DNA helicase RecQ [Rhodothermus marinus]
MSDAAADRYETARALLRRYWRHDDFRPGQWEIIQAVLQGQDVLAVLPTGGGKSVCYQLPALLLDGLTLVVSPLLALIEDQVARLRARGIPAAFLHGQLAPHAAEQCWIDAEHGAYRLLYVTPEQLTTARFEARAGRLRVALLAVDEAHCVSEWGPQFRPAYLHLPEARRQLGDPPLLALTATATPRVRQDIVEKLALRTPRIIVRGFDRPNLVWSVFETAAKAERVRAVLRGVPGPGILYCATRRSAERWTETLRRLGVEAVCYHGGLSAADRAAASRAWREGQARVVAATSAFGMGIDRADVRFVLHAELPPSLEAYYQEAGRAGRDGRKAYAVLLFQEKDIDLQRQLIALSYPARDVVARIYEVACSLAQVPVGTRPNHPVLFDAERIACIVGVPPGAVRHTLELLTRQEVWEPIWLPAHYVLLRLRGTPNDFRRFAAATNNPRLARFVEALLRAIPADAFSTWWPVSLRRLSRRTGVERERLLRGLDFLRERALLDWLSSDRARLVRLKIARPQRLSIDDRLLRQAREQAEARLEALVRYARTTSCRRHFLLTYFGESAPERCNACDVCLKRSGRRNSPDL